MTVKVDKGFSLVPFLALLRRLEKLREGEREKARERAHHTIARVLLLSLLPPRRGKEGEERGKSDARSVALLEIARVQAKGSLLAHFLSFSSSSFKNSERSLSLSLARARAALPARDVFQQHAPGTSPVERRGVDDSAAQSGGDDEVSVVVFVVFGRRLFFFFINVAILDCRSPLELRPARLFRTPCVSTRPLSKRGAAKGKLARRGGELNRGK
jgi:hypothetical protein